MKAKNLWTMGLILLFPLVATAQNPDTYDLLARCQGKWVCKNTGEGKSFKYTIEFDDRTRTTTLEFNGESRIYVEDVRLKFTKNLMFLTAENRRIVQGEFPGAKA